MKHAYCLMAAGEACLRGVGLSFVGLPTARVVINIWRNAL